MVILQEQLVDLVVLVEAEGDQTALQSVLLVQEQQVKEIMVVQVHELATLQEDQLAEAAEVLVLLEQMVIQLQKLVMVVMVQHHLLQELLLQELVAEVVVHTLTKLVKAVLVVAVMVVLVLQRAQMQQ